MEAKPKQRFFDYQVEAQAGVEERIEQTKQTELEQAIFEEGLSCTEEGRPAGWGTPLRGQPHRPAAED